MAKRTRNIIYFNSGAIGEFLMSLYFLENVHENDPRIEITMFVSRNHGMLSAIAAENYPYLRIVDLNKKTFALVRRISSMLSSTNIVITPQSFGRIVWKLKFLSKALSLAPGSKMIGFDDGHWANKHIYDHLIDFKTQSSFFEAMQLQLRILGMEVKKPEFLFKYGYDHDRISDLTSGAKYVVVCPFATAKRRSLPPERWADLLTFLAARGGFKIFVVGSKADRNAAADILSLTQGDVTDLTGDNSLQIQEVAGLINGASLFIGVDSGISHLAASIGVRSLVVGNYSNPAWLPTYNKQAVILYKDDVCECPPCNKQYCMRECVEGYLVCMASIDQNLIKDKIIELLRYEKA